MGEIILDDTGVIIFLRFIDLKVKITYTCMYVTHTYIYIELHVCKVTHIESHTHTHIHRKRKREKDLIQSLNGYNCQCWTRLKAGAERLI